MQMRAFRVADLSVKLHSWHYLEHKANRVAEMAR